MLKQGRQAKVVHLPWEVLRHSVCVLAFSFLPLRSLRQGSLSPTPRSGSVMCAIDLREIACAISWLPLYGVRPLAVALAKCFESHTRTL